MVRHQPFSPQTAQKASRLRGAAVTDGVCPYCAVGCGQLIFTKGGRLIDIDGDPRSPISEGTLCPKGANSFQLSVNPHRVTHVMYRAPYSDRWEQKPLDWALDTIARRVKAVRDADFTTGDKNGRRLNALHSIGTLGGASSVMVCRVVRALASSTCSVAISVRSQSTARIWN